MVVPLTWGEKVDFRDLVALEGMSRIRELEQVVAGAAKAIGPGSDRMTRDMVNEPMYINIYTARQIRMKCSESTNQETVRYRTDGAGRPREGQAIQSL